VCVNPPQQPLQEDFLCLDQSRPRQEQASRAECSMEGRALAHHSAPLNSQSAIMFTSTE